MMKVIGTGNILLSDDGIGIRVVEELSKEMAYDDNIEFIVGETDFYYCIDNINQGDFLIIIDSTILGKEPGDVTVIPFEECDKYIKGAITEHGDSLIKVIRRENSTAEGICIGIEAETIAYSTELSKNLKDRLQVILLEVKKVIAQYNLLLENKEH